MFEISIPEIKKCILELESQEKEIESLIRQLDSVRSQLSCMTADGAEKKSLQVLVDELLGEKKIYSALISTLRQITEIYQNSDKKILSDFSPQRKEFGLSDFSDLDKMLKNLNINFN